MRLSNFQLGGRDYLVLSFDLFPVLKESPLTRAEEHVLRRLLGGNTTRQIARIRKTSPRTVDNQINVIFRKLQVHSRSELITALGRSRARLGETPDRWPAERL
jgi:DNA-binding CsgD family transcriptional regulator